MIAALLLSVLVLAQRPAAGAAPAVQHMRAIVLTVPRAALTMLVAANELQRERGLMGVRRLPPHTGMLFVFPAQSVWSFWMKDTPVDLDMVWVSADGAVTRVAANVPHVAPHTPDDRIPVRDGYGAYVLELPAGEAAQDGLTKGAHVAGLPPLSPG